MTTADQLQQASVDSPLFVILFLAVLTLCLLSMSCFLFSRPPTPRHYTLCVFKLPISLGIVVILIPGAKPYGWSQRQMRKWTLTAKTSWKEGLIFLRAGHRSNSLLDQNVTSRAWWCLQQTEESVCSTREGSLNCAPAASGNMAQYCPISWHFKRSQESILWKISRLWKYCVGQIKYTHEQEWFVGH